MNRTEINSRHDFLTSRRDRKLEIYLTGTGVRVAPPHRPYHVYEENVPYQWQHGRILSDFGLVFLTSGKGTFESENHPAYEVTAGDLLVLSPGIWHNYRPEENTGWSENWVTFNGSFVAGQIHQIAKELPVPVVHAGFNPAISQLFHTIFQTAENSPPFIHDLFAGLLLQLLATIRGGLLQQGKAQEEHLLIQKARQVLDTQLDQPVDMEALAESLMISYRHFRRIFTAGTGFSPHQYLLHRRILHAKLLLEQRSLKVHEIACRVGFNDPFHFSRVFKQLTGSAPRDWGYSTLNPPKQ